MKIYLKFSGVEKFLLEKWFWINKNFPEQIFDPKIIDVPNPVLGKKEYCKTILGSDKKFKWKINTSPNKFFVLKLFNQKNSLFPRTSSGAKDLLDSKKFWI